MNEKILSEINSSLKQIAQILKAQTEFQTQQEIIFAKEVKNETKSKTKRKA